MGHCISCDKAQTCVYIDGGGQGWIVLMIKMAAEPPIFLKRSPHFYCSSCGGGKNIIFPLAAPAAGQNNCTPRAEEEGRLDGKNVTPGRQPERKRRRSRPGVNSSKPRREDPEYFQRSGPSLGSNSSRPLQGGPQTQARPKLKHPPQGGP